MDLNRYKIENGKYVFHTFSQGQKFNTSVWLENDGRFEKKTEIVTDESGAETVVDIGYYTYYNEDGTPDLVKEQELGYQKALADWKSERQTKVDNIEVIYNDVIYQGDEVSQTRMARAITSMTDDTVTIPWVAKDNSVYDLTRVDLKAILLDAGNQQSFIWNDGRPS